MALFFDGDNDNLVSSGDIVTARFLSTAAWTLCIFLRRADGTTGQDDVIVAKWGGVASTRQLSLEARDDPPVIWFRHRESTRIASTFNVLENVWYAIGAKCDGSANMGLFIVGMDGTVHENSTGTTTGDVADLTTNVTIGTNAPLSADLKGDMAYACYIDKALSIDEFVEWSRQPYLSFVKHGGQFFLPMAEKVPEPDWSGKKNHFFRTGTPTLTDNPPVAPTVNRNRIYQANVQRSGGLFVG
jgi:hypothetical protein